MANQSATEGAMGQRAKMSNWQSRQEFELLLAGQGMWPPAVDAEREARAILTETEPHDMAATYGPTVRIDYPAIGAPAYAALAEALRAFVTCPEIPAGYGTNPDYCACGACETGLAFVGEAVRA
jgi:hypothetical protein